MKQKALGADDAHTRGKDNAGFTRCRANAA